MAHDFYAYVPPITILGAMMTLHADGAATWYLRCMGCGTVEEQQGSGLLCARCATTHVVLLGPCDDIPPTYQMPKGMNRPDVEAALQRRGYVKRTATTYR
jgi:hypothetical protein